MPFPSPGDLADPGIELASPALADGFFTTRATWEAQVESISLVYSEKAMAPHSSILAWQIPWMEESGGPQSMG